jgi:hypothetical protein
MFRRNEKIELQTRRAMRQAARRAKGADRQFILDALDNDEVVAMVGDAVVMEARGSADFAGADDEETFSGPFLDAIVELFKSFIENPEKLMNLIKMIMTLFAV